MGCTDDNTLHSAATGACLAEFSLCLRDCSAHAISLQRENEAQELLALVVVKWWQCSRWELSPPWDARHCWAGMLHVRAGFAPAGQAWRVFYCNNEPVLGNNWSLLFKVRCSLICSDILSGLQRPWLLTAFPTASVECSRNLASPGKHPISRWIKSPSSLFPFPPALQCG